MDLEEERIALFLDYENLAIGARDRLEGMRFDLRPVLDALAERGRVIARKAYADWSYFDEDRRMLTRSHVELIEIPQRMGASRKNSADIKLCVDALEMAFERDYVTTFVICTGDSDFTPLVHKLRELNKRVIGVGIKESTSKLLPPACDEFLYYEALEGVDVPAERRRGRRGERSSAVGGTTRGARARARRGRGATRVDAAAGRGSARDPDRADGGGPRANRGRAGAGLVGEARTRKDPTFSEADHGFRAFGELLRHLADRNVIELSEGAAKGDPEVSLPSQGGETEAFDLLREVVADLGAQGTVQLSGLKNRVRKVRPDFSEKKYGYRGFLQFCRAAATQGFVTLQWDAAAEDYVVAIRRNGVAAAIECLIETGSKRTFACAAAWPGWCRQGRDEDAAMQALEAYRPRYASALEAHGVPFGGIRGSLRIAERTGGNATTDFGAPDGVYEHDAEAISARGGLGFGAYSRHAGRRSIAPSRPPRRWAAEDRVAAVAISGRSSATSWAQR